MLAARPARLGEASRTPGAHRRRCRPGPHVPAGREEAFVLHDTTVSEPVHLTGEGAQGTALAVASGAVIEACAADGRTMYQGDWQTDVTAAKLADAVSTEQADIPLPAFDEYLMAYTDRSDIITPSVTVEVGPTKNGLVHPGVLRAGVVTARR